MLPARAAQAVAAVVAPAAAARVAAAVVRAVLVQVAAVPAAPRAVLAAKNAVFCGAAGGISRPPSRVSASLRVRRKLGLDVRLERLEAVSPNTSLGVESGGGLEENCIERRLGVERKTRGLEIFDPWADGRAGVRVRWTGDHERFRVG